MGRIRIDPDSLRAYVAALNSRISEFESLGGRLDSLNGSINSSWTGAAQVSYASMMENYMQQIRQLEAILSQFRGYAQDSADRFENLDLECAQRIRNSF